MRLAGACSIVATLVALAGAADADAAANFFVNANSNGSTCGRNDPCKTITKAVNKAADDDTIPIAVGTYNESISTSKRLTFDGGGIGTGIFHNGSTTLRGTTAGPPLELPRGGTVRDMVVVAADGPGGQQYQNALDLSVGNTGGVAYSVTNVVAVSGADSSHSPGAKAGGKALDADEGAQHVTLTVHASTLFGHEGTNPTALVAGASTDASFDHVDVSAPQAGAAVSSAGSLLSIRGGTLTGAQWGLAVGGGAT